MSWRDYDHEDLTQVWEVLDEFKVVADTAQVLTTLVSFLLGLYVVVGLFLLSFSLSLPLFPIRSKK